VRFGLPRREARAETETFTADVIAAFERRGTIR
jgi:hypothetical protein